MKNTSTNETTHFGYKEVPVKEKARRVADVFNSVASKYDVMNDVMSLGVHRLWKRMAVDMSGVRPGQRVLDLAAGTGDLTALFAQRLGPEGEIVSTDINSAMLACGRDRMIDRGQVNNIHYAQADAESLPFTADSFDCVTIAFGLRNVTSKEKALRSIYEVLKPGGSLLVLEFSQPTVPALRPAYDFYSFNVLPFMGKLITKDADSYRYLAESIRKHPDQETLKAMMEEAGFEACVYHNLSAGIVALHRGYKY